MRTFKSAALTSCLSLTMLLSTIVGTIPVEAQEIVWRSYQELAQKHLKSGNLDMAERLSLEAVDVAEKIPPHHGVLVESLKLLADIYQAQKKQPDYEKTQKRIAEAEKKDAEPPATTSETKPGDQTATANETKPADQTVTPEPMSTAESVAEPVVQPVSNNSDMPEPADKQLGASSAEAPNQTSAAESDTKSGITPEKVEPAQP